MPTPTIPDGELFMNATLYTGNGGTQTITNGVAGQSFQPDFVWLKTRSTVQNHSLIDSVRGNTKILYSDLTNAEGTFSGVLDSFNSNGFTLGSSASVNQNGTTFVGWQWKAGGAAVTNTAGTISSQVSANTTSGFSVVTYTGNGSGGATVGHGLGVAPQFIIVKNRADGSTNWYCYNQYLDATSPQNYTIYLSLTNARDAASVFWNNTAPTSSVFTIGSSSGVNGSGNAMVAYCWTPIAGYSAFGSYTGNGSTDGPFVYLGFRPRFVMIKASSISSEHWYIVDATRSPYNAAILYLSPDDSDAETSPGAAQFFDFLSNGFKLRVSGSYSNSSGATYIYMAFAENPFKYANAR
jgi:hypothetical protein